MCPWKPVYEKERRMHPYFIATTSSSWLPKINILPPKADFSPGRPEHSKLFVKIMLRDYRHDFEIKS